MNNKWILALLLALALFGGFYLYTKFRVAPSLDFAKLGLRNLAGETVTIQSFKGRKLVLCFSASWCGNCWQELSSISKLRSTELKEIEFVVISDEPVEKIHRFNERFPGQFSYLQLSTDFASVGIQSIPTTYLLTADSEVVKKHVGYIDWEDPSTREHLKTLME